MEYSEDEEFTLLFPGTNTVVYNSGIPTPNVTVTKHVCISRSPNYQYDLLYTNSDGPWESGSWLEIRGIYDNRVFRSFYWPSRFRVSLLNPIYKNEEWYWTTDYYQDWYSMTSDDWDTTVHEVLPITDKPHFFRKSFVGLQRMAAYEARFYYKHGIVAYLNGVEIYRDNMPKGIVLPSTKAIGAYHQYQYRGLIRNGQEAADNGVLAVEIHTIQEEAIEFDGWLGLYASSRDMTISLKVYPVPVYSASFEGRSSMEYAYDDHINSSITFDIIVQGETYFEYYTQQAQVTMWSYYCSQKSHAMTKFRVHGQIINSEEWSPLSTTTPYNVDEQIISFIYTGTHLTPPSSHYRIYPIQSNGLPVYVGEMQPYVNNSPIIYEVEAVEFQDSYEFVVHSYISVQPTYWSSGFICLSEPELPEGLVFNKCSIEGTPSKIQESKTYFIYMYGNIGTRRRYTSIKIVEDIVIPEQGSKWYIWFILICIIVIIIVGILVVLWFMKPKEPKDPLPIIHIEDSTNQKGIVISTMPQETKIVSLYPQSESSTSSIEMHEFTSIPAVPRNDSGSNASVVLCNPPTTQASEVAETDVSVTHSSSDGSDTSREASAMNTTTPELSNSTLPPQFVVLDSGQVIDVNSLPPEQRAEIIKQYDL